VFARLGRYGPMLQIGEAEDEEKPKFATMPEGKKMETITLEEALEMFKLPRVVGKTPKGEEITANFGRFGPYIKYGEKKYVSIKPLSPLEISVEEALEFVTKKEEEEANRVIRDFKAEGIQILNGPYGPYITDGTKNARVPKDQDPTKIELAEAQELLAKARPRKRRPRIRK
jgi:DNA topoisomerase I